MSISQYHLAFRIHVLYIYAMDNTSAMQLPSSAYTFSQSLPPPPPLRNKLPVPYIAVKQYWPSLCVTLSQNLQNIIVLQRTIMASEDTQFISVNVGMRRWTIGIGRCTFSWFMQR